MTKTRLYLKACLIMGMSLLLRTSSAQICANPNGNITVTNTNDDGPGSLREALSCANTTAGANLIRFDIGGAGPHVIDVGAMTNQALPALLDLATVIDARTQAGYLDEPLIILDGGSISWSSPINAIWIRADFCEVYGLEIRNFPDDGIDLRTADQTIIQDNYIHDNGSDQDYFPGAPGTGPWEGCGIVLREGSDFNLISRNNIENNEYCGILLRNGGNDNLIGGPLGEDANNISDNAVGIRIGDQSTGIHIQQNGVFCNDTIGIELVGNANNNQLLPVITAATTSQISGTANDGDVIEVFQSVSAYCPGAVCQGSIWMGTTVAVNGSWILNAPFQSGGVVGAGPAFTATATDASGNTSAFSACKIATGTSGCTSSSGEISVTNTNDTGTGSLRQAILCANTTLGANTIRFDIPGDSIHTIYIGSEANEALPALTDPATIIDATTQAGFGDNGNYQPRIILDGSQANWTAPINAVWIRSDYCEVYGLEITRFPDDGIDVTLADHVIVGDINKGNVVYNNGDPIDFWPDLPGTGPWNGCGIVLRQGSDHCIVKGNIIGTDYEQVDTSGNELCGIVILNGGDDHLIANNIIAHHALGIRMGNGGIRNTLTQNSLYCNDSIPIHLIGNANLNISPPQIDSASNVYLSGFADSLDLVEVFLNRDSACAGVPCQGRDYLGTATVIDSTWILTAPFANNVLLKNGDFITATATDTLGNTSAFSTCQAVAVLCDLDLSISNLMPATCGADNGAFTINVLNGTGPYTLDIGQGATTDTIFDNLAVGNYTITVTDALACTATISQLIINEGIAPIAAFSYTVDEATLSFSNSSSSGETYQWDFDDGNTTTLENPVHTFEISGDYEVCLTTSNPCGSDVYCETITVLVPLLDVNIGGVIAKENGQTTALTTVNCTANPAQETEADGLYLFENQGPGNDFVIEPFKDINYLNGCTTYDLFLINQHILESSLLDSPYKIIAADVDHSGSVSTIDLIRLQQVILINVDTFPNNTSWRFVPADYVFLDPENPLDEDFPESITLTNVIEDDLDNDFVAIKVGDVNGNANPLALVNPNEELNVAVEVFEERGETVVLEFQPEALKTISAFELSLSIDPRYLSFVHTTLATEHQPEVFYDKNSGMLNLSWYDRKGIGVKSDELRFQLSFQKKASDWRNGLGLSNQLRPRTFDTSGNPAAIQLDFQHQKNQTPQVFPNPFEAQTSIAFNLPESRSILLRVFDLNGALIFEQSSFFEQGKNTIDINLENHPSGMYFYELDTERGVLIKG